MKRIGIVIIIGIAFIAGSVIIFWDKIKSLFQAPSPSAAPETTASQPTYYYSGGSSSTASTNEVMVSNTDLSGVVPTGYLFGYNSTTGKTFYKNSSGNWAANSTTTLSTPLTATLASKAVANGNTEKFIVPVTALIAFPNHYDFKITTDISSQTDILYNVIGLQKDNELVIEISNNSGVDINTLPLSISYLKLN